MRTKRQLKALKSRRNKHAVFSIVVAVVMLIAFYQLPQFQYFNFINLSPVYFVVIVCLSFFEKAKNEQPKKNNLLLNILFMRAPFIIINGFALSRLSKFVDYSAVHLAHYLLNHKQSRFHANLPTVLKQYTFYIGVKSYYSLGLNTFSL